MGITKILIIMRAACRIAAMRSGATDEACVKPVFPKAALSKSRLLPWIAVLTVLSVVGPAAWALTDEAVHAATQPHRAAGDKITASDIHIKFRPQSVTIQKSLVFDQNGNPQPQQAQNQNLLQMSFVSSLQSKYTVLSYKIISVDKVITASGRKLDVQFYPNDVQRIGANNFINDQLQLNVSVPSPGIVQSIRTVQGKIKFFIAVGKTRRAVLSPVSKYMNRRVKIPDLGNDVWINITHGDLNNFPMLQAQQQQPVVKIALSRQAYQKLDQVQFQSKDGDNLEAQDWGDGQDNDVYFRQYTVTVPKDARIIIRFWSKLQAVTLPFTITNIPMPGSLDQHKTTQLSRVIRRGSAHGAG